MRHSGRSVYAAAIIILVLAIITPAWAEEEYLPDGFMLRLGGYSIQNANTIVRLDATDYPIGTYIDFNETLGGDTTATAARLDGLYRFNDKHGIGFAWYNMKFTGSRELGKDITWGDYNFLLSTQVDSEIKFDIYKLNYQYSLHHSKEVELGVLVGFHVMRVSAGISATNIGESRSESVTAPLPVFGLYADYSFTPRFSAYYNYQFFFINYQDKIKGGLQDFLLGIEYRLFRNVGVGAAFNRFGLHVKAKQDVTTLYLDTNWNGLMLYGSLYF